MDRPVILALVLVLTMLYFFTPLNSVFIVYGASSQVANNYSFILGTDGGDELQCSSILGKYEEKAFTRSRNDIWNMLVDFVAERGKTYSVLDVYQWIRSHSYNPQRLQSAVFSKLVNTPPQGVLFVFGHFNNPYQYIYFQYKQDIEYPGAPFPKQWGQEYITCTIKAHDVGNKTRAKDLSLLPRIVIMIGCNTAGKNDVIYFDKKDTWLWAYRFHGDDFPDYWYYRGFIGTLSDIKIYAFRTTPIFKYMQETFVYTIDMGLPLFEALYRVVKENYDYNFKYFYIDENTKQSVSGGLYIPGVHETLSYVGGYHVYMDPELKDVIISYLINHIKENYPEIYQLLKGENYTIQFYDHKEKLAIGYNYYSVVWKSDNTTIFIDVYSNGLEHVIRGITIYVKNVYSDKQYDLLYRIRDRILRKLNSTLEEFRQYGFSFTNMSWTNSTTRYDISYMLQYNSIPIYIYKNYTEQKPITISLHYTVSLNDFYLVYFNDFLLFKKYIRLWNNSFLEFKINEEQVIDKIIDKMYTYGEKISKNNIKEIHKEYLLLKDSIIPAYYVEVVVGDRVYEFVINGITSKIIGYDIGLLLDGSHDNTNSNTIVSNTSTHENIDSPNRLIPITLGITILTIVFIIGIYSRMRKLV